jgi:putative transposase
LKALFGGAVSKDTVSRVWRKVKADWDAWNARSLDRRAGCAAYSRWHGGRRAARPQGNRNLAAGRPWRADGQKVLLAVKAMGGESSDAWRSVLD